MPPARARVLMDARVGAGERALPRYWVHELQMLRFAERGAGVLVHHHPGAETHGRPRYDSDSRWIITQGGGWVDRFAVVTS